MLARWKFPDDSYSMAFFIPEETWDMFDWFELGFKLIEDGESMDNTDMALIHSVDGSVEDAWCF